MRGIDVSENNGFVDWQTVKDAGMEFAMVRTGFGRRDKDSHFDENVAGAHSVGLKVGAYHYSYALNADRAVEEAAFCKKIIDESGVGLELPVFFDMEDADGYKKRNGFNFDPELITEMCRTFISNLGLDCGVYASLSWLANYIDWRSLNCAVWNAEWGSSDSIKGYMWQYTNSLYIAGKQFDGNILYD